MATIKREKVYDNQTGEIHLDREKVVSFSLFNEDRGYLLFLNRHNVRIFPHIEFPEGIGKMDMANLYLLSRHIYSTTNMLGYRSNGTVRPMTPGQIGETVGLCGQRFDRWMSRMSKLGMIARVKVKIESVEHTQYYMNPLYFFSDKYLPLNLYLLFQTQIDRHLPEWVKQKYRDMRSTEDKP